MPTALPLAYPKQPFPCPPSLLLPTAEARRRPHEAVALPIYADGDGYADGHPGGADGIYADGNHRRTAVPTAFLAMPTA
jgi:hypothetical protein